MRKYKLGGSTGIAISGTETVIGSTVIVIHGTLIVILKCSNHC